METKIIDTKVLGEIVKETRKKTKLSQIEVAAICKVGVRFLSDLENGKPTLEFTKVLRVLKGLGLELIIKNKGWK